ncbi:glycoside hydrolase superfamily [Chytriomyces sp. MP71]|nr:glycoside hydrolase superfamily [Chytriomyces sp. MP71]
MANTPVKLAWGFGGSAMQMEGGWNQGGKGLNVFDAAYSAGRQAYAGSGTPFRAADHYNKWKEDIGYLGQLGATAYRFSVSWPRILPNCTGTVNQEGVKFYSDLIDEVRRQGAEPYLTMFHWDLPQACQDQFQGFQSDKIVDAFANYASVLLDNFGSKITYFLTLNEPRANCDFCVRQPQFAPFTTTSDDVFYQCMHNSILAHGTVVQAARARKDNPGWKFSLPSITDWHDPDPGAGAGDVSGSTILQAQWYFDPCFFGDYGADMKAKFPLPTFTAEQQTLIKGTCDYIAVNMYNSDSNGGGSIPPGEGSPYTAQEVQDPTALQYWPHPNPEGTVALPLFLYQRYNKEVVITEMGYHVPRQQESTFAQAVQDDLRVQYWQLNGPQVLSLIKDHGVPLTAMLAWSLIDNYEFETYEFRWGHIAVDYWDPATGLVNTDKGSLKRQIKQSALFMKEFFGNNTVSPFNSRRNATTTVSTTTAAMLTSSSVPSEPATASGGTQAVATNSKTSDAERVVGTGLAALVLGAFLL